MLFRSGRDDRVRGERVGLEGRVDGRAEEQVLGHSQLGIERQLGPRVSDAAPPLGWGHRRTIHVQDRAAAARPQETGHDLEQRALAGAVAPAAGDTTLGNELGRAALTSQNTAANVTTYAAGFAAGVGTGAITEAADHFEFYWVPHTKWALTKHNTRTSEPAAPRSAMNKWLSKTVLENYAFGAVCAVGKAVPGLIPRLATALPSSGRQEFVEASHDVFATRRLVRFHEME